MDRIETFSLNSQIESTFLNQLQDRVRSVMRPAGSLEITATTRTARAVINQFAGAGNQVGATSYKAIDQAANGFDWRGAMIEGWITTVGSTADRIGGTNPEYLNTYLKNAKRFVAYLGTGSTTSFDRGSADYYIEADWDGAAFNFIVYADNATGELRVYNTTGIARGCIVMVECIIKC